jgi:hypothetical protein
MDVDTVIKLLENLDTNYDFIVNGIRDGSIDVHEDTRINKVIFYNCVYLDEITVRFKAYRILRYLFDHHPEIIYKFDNIRTWVYQSRKYYQYLDNNRDNDIVKVSKYYLLDQLMIAKKKYTGMYMTNDQFNECYYYLSYEDLEYILYRGYHLLTNLNYNILSSLGIKLLERDGFDQLDRFQLLLDYGADPNAYTKNFDLYQNNLVRYLRDYFYFISDNNIRFEDDEIYQNGVSIKQKIIDNLNKDDENISPYITRKLPLHELCHKHNKNNHSAYIKVINLLLEYGANPMIKENISDVHQNKNAIEIICNEYIQEKLDDYVSYSLSLTKYTPVDLNIDYHCISSFIQKLVYKNYWILLCKYFHSFTCKDILNELLTRQDESGNTILNMLIGSKYNLLLLYDLDHLGINLLLIYDKLSIIQTTNFNMRQQKIFRRLVFNILMKDPTSMIYYLLVDLKQYIYYFL